ncbi:CrcB family protein [Nocardioides sp. 616]|uniref:fluoride efflux transporter FluC n=1 Tax=Nocardioides sp. 616 TaxID=2268090 RepID=UPI000CE56162|nr:CrcB family protein [Nocardioides sp. 616]
MSPGLFTLLVLAGGVGAGVRYVVDGAIRSRIKTLFPWPTALINMSGSLVLGGITGLVAGDLASTAVSAVLGTGFLGGYTTFSTASYETVDLVRARHYAVAALYAFGVLAASVALAYLGYSWGVDA